MKRTLLVLMMALLAAMLFVSCSNNADELQYPDVAFTDLKGTWMTSFGNEYVSLYFYVSTGDSTSADMARLTEVKSGASDKESEMEVSINGATITFTATDATEYKYKARIDGKKLILTQVGDKSFLKLYSDKTLTMSKAG